MSVASGNEMAMMIIGSGVMLVFFAGVAWGLLSVAWMIFGRSLAPRFLYPIELRLLQWLQDRATARMFNTTVDIVRFRRKAETPED
jgi:hypothetical protein